VGAIVSAWTQHVAFSRRDEVMHDHHPAQTGTGTLLRPLQSIVKLGGLRVVSGK